MTGGQNDGCIRGPGPEGWGNPMNGGQRNGGIRLPGRGADGRRYPVARGIGKSGDRDPEGQRCFHLGYPVIKLNQSQT